MSKYFVDRGIYIEFPSIFFLNLWRCACVCLNVSELCTHIIKFYHLLHATYIVHSWLIPCYTIFSTLYILNVCIIFASFDFFSHIDQKQRFLDEIGQVGSYKKKYSNFRLATRSFHPIFLNWIKPLNYYMHKKCCPIPLYKAWIIQGVYETINLRFWKVWCVLWEDELWSVMRQGGILRP